METLMRKDKNHITAVLPVLTDTLSRLKAKTASNNPPTIRKIQFIIVVKCKGCKYTPFMFFLDKALLYLAINTNFGQLFNPLDKHSPFK